MWTPTAPHTLSPKSHLWPRPKQWPQSVSSSWPPGDGDKCGHQCLVEEVRGVETWRTWPCCRALLKPNGLTINYMTHSAGPLRTEEPGERSRVVSPVHTSTFILMATSNHWSNTGASVSSLRVKPDMVWKENVEILDPEGHLDHQVPPLHLDHMDPLGCQAERDRRCTCLCLNNHH